MSLKVVGPDNDERAAVDKLADIADAIFGRATKLDGIHLTRRDEAAEQIISETRDECFQGCIEVWKVILEMLPSASLTQLRRRELEVDGHKVVSRCHHRLGSFKEAQASITKAIDLGYAEGYISLGAILLDRKDFKGAESAFRTAIAKNAQAMRAHAGLGELFFALGRVALKDDPTHAEYFKKAEEHFVVAGKERFAETYERAMDLFETIGWRERAMEFGERAIKHYNEHRAHYADRLRNIDTRLRKLAGEERHDRLLNGVGRRLGDILSGGEREAKK
ncbi:MAG: tetratricopeptide repeat protein [Myxococcota bacterium]|nr:tetratricopeptide repeat protein [Myxococcota bacterium]